MSLFAFTGCHVATMDSAGTEYRDGYVVVRDGVIEAVGAGPLSADRAVEDVEVVATDGLLTPGLVNTHHHLYQWVTRGYATDDTLFGWLTTLYPRWSRLTEETTYAAAAGNLAWMALSGCTTSSDHHYVFPHDGGVPRGDLLEAEILGAQRIGLRFHPARGSMDLGASQGGLPPDEVVEDRESALAATEAAIDRWHDPAPGSMLRVVVAPCSPFSASQELMREAAVLARVKGVHLHTHLAETLDEQDFCRENYGRTPTEYAEDLGWLGPDVWMAHCVHLDPASIDRFAATGTGVAHCPTSNGRLGSGIAPVRDLLAAGVPVGLGVDGSASNESGRMVDELHQSLLVARCRDGSLALTARQVLAMATTGGARVLGREDIGSIEVGKQADLALWDVGGMAGAGIDDPLCTLVFGTPTLRDVYVGGATVVRDGELRTADPDTLAADVRRAAAAIRTA